MFTASSDDFVGLAESVCIPTEREMSLRHLCILWEKGKFAI